MAELDLDRVQALYKTKVEISKATNGKTDHGKILRDALKEAQNVQEEGRGSCERPRGRKKAA